MTIKEVEEKTGLTRSNVRFYEKEKLIDPLRNEKNGYRNYSEKDVDDLKKIAFLRTLGISIEDIRNVISKRATLSDVIQTQSKVLEGQIKDLNNAKMICEQMISAKYLDYETLQAEQYVSGLQDYWNQNQPVFKLDSVRFLYIWGSFLTWTAITALCLIAGILTYAKLPPQIPVQWNQETAVSLVNKNFIFAYPAVCAAVRYLLRPCLQAKLKMYSPRSSLITEYLTNYMCFTALSVEIFSILYIYGIVKNIVILLAIDTIVLISLLIWGLTRTQKAS